MASRTRVRDASTGSAGGAVATGVSGGLGGSNGGHGTWGLVVFIVLGLQQLRTNSGRPLPLCGSTCSDPDTTAIAYRSSGSP